MNEAHLITVTRELNLKLPQVNAVADLLADGATIPFIARYRKEVTGSLDEVVVAQVRDRLEQLSELQKRRETILKSLEENGHLTDELQNAVQQADTLSKLEDVYLPYRPKRRTRATAAREKGLEPLAELIFAQNGCDPVEAAAPFIDVDKQVNTHDEALAGARDIIAEWVAEDTPAREKMRALFATRSTLKSRVAAGKETEGAKYRDYFEWEEPAVKAPSHRILAMRRGERDDILNLTVAPPKKTPCNSWKPCLSRAAVTMPNRCAWLSMTATSACFPGPWKPRSAWPLRNVRIWMRYAFSPTICVNC